MSTFAHKMEAKRLYIIGGPNGAGKTTASYSVLPEMLHCREFINADEIAHGLSPFNPEGMAIEAGRLMLRRIEEQLGRCDSFAIETTLATRSYAQLVHRAQEKGFEVWLIYFWLASPEQAKQRVRERVAHGGHSISDHVITRRFYAGLANLLNIYIPIVDSWMIVDNSVMPRHTVAAGGYEKQTIAYDENIYNNILQYVRQRT